MKTKLFMIPIQIQTIFNAKSIRIQKQYIISALLDNDAKPGFLEQMQGCKLLFHDIIELFSKCFVRFCKM